MLARLTPGFLHNYVRNSSHNVVQIQQQNLFNEGQSQCERPIEILQGKHQSHPG